MGITSRSLVIVTDHSVMSFTAALASVVVLFHAGTIRTAEKLGVGVKLG